MWPTRPSGRWAADLSLAGWCHVVYVTGELGLLLAWALSPAPPAVVWLVTIILSLHVPLGVLQPAWFATGRLLTLRSAAGDAGLGGGVGGWPLRSCEHASVGRAPDVRHAVNESRATRPLSSDKPSSRCTRSARIEVTPSSVCSMPSTSRNGDSITISRVVA